MSGISNQRLGFAIIVGVALIILICGIRGLVGILDPILVAAVITITLLPVPLALAKGGIKNGPALLITILLVFHFIVCPIAHFVNFFRRSVGRTGREVRPVGDGPGIPLDGTMPAKALYTKPAPFC